MLERAAPSDATVLIEGETGTGKEGAAASLHDASRARAAGRSSSSTAARSPANLLESELFGHERGAFTGATERRAVRSRPPTAARCSSTRSASCRSSSSPSSCACSRRASSAASARHRRCRVDVRIVAATNRDLRAEVNAGTFRADLYYRLAVVKLELPPLRERPDDLPLLVARIVETLGLDAAAAAKLTCAPEFVASLGRGAWPGNVRELRNYLERCAVLDELAPVAADPGAPAVVDASRPYQQARDDVLAEFERRYVEALLQAHRGNVSAAARASGIDRTYLHRLMRRHRLR